MRFLTLTLLTFVAMLVPATAQGQSLPPLQPDLNLTGAFICEGPVNRNVVTININQPTTNAVQFRTNCTGRIGSLRVTGAFADCIRVAPVQPVAHDVTVQSGWCRVTGPPQSGVHQDCIQAGGGRNFLFQNFVWDCTGPGGGQFFIAGFSGGDPDNFTCDHCAFGPRQQNQIRTPSDNGAQGDPTISGVRNSRVCLTSRAPYLPANGNLGGNETPPGNSAGCTFDGLMAFVGAGGPPPTDPECSDDGDNDGDGLTDFPADPGCTSPQDDSEADVTPPPAPAPVLTTCGNYALVFFACWTALQNVTRYLFDVDGTQVSTSNNPSLTRVKFGKQVGTHQYCVTAVYASGSGRSCLTVTR